MHTMSILGIKFIVSYLLAFVFFLKKAFSPVIPCNACIATIFTFKYSIYLAVILAYGVRQRFHLNFFTLYIIY